MSLVRIAAPLLTGLVLAFCPVPSGLAPHAWYYFAVFASVIVALIAEPIPAAAVGVLGVTLAGLLGLPFTPAQIAGPGFNLPAESIK